MCVCQMLQSTPDTATLLPTKVDANASIAVTADRNVVSACTGVHGMTWIDAIWPLKHSQGPGRVYRACDHQQTCTAAESHASCNATVLMVAAPVHSLTEDALPKTAPYRLLLYGAVPHMGLSLYSGCTRAEQYSRTEQIKRTRQGHCRRFLLTRGCGKCSEW